eukprot:Gb_16603 [translate_table: standard]
MKRDPVTSNADSDWSGNQTCNPPFVHNLAVPEENLAGENFQVVSAARGDGVIDIIDIGFDIDRTDAKHRQASNTRKGFPSKSTKNGNTKESIATGEKTQGMRIQLHAGLGGHTAAASCVTFSRFGEAGKFIISGSNDASVKVWDWARQIRTAESSSGSEGPLRSSINNRRKALAPSPQTYSLIAMDLTRGGLKSAECHIGVPVTEPYCRVLNRIRYSRSLVHTHNLLSQKEQYWHSACKVLTPKSALTEGRFLTSNPLGGGMASGGASGRGEGRTGRKGAGGSGAAGRGGDGAGAAGGGGDGAGGGGAGETHAVSGAGTGGEPCVGPGGSTGVYPVGLGAGGPGMGGGPGGGEGGTIAGGFDEESAQAEKELIDQDQTQARKGFNAIL